MTTYDRLVQRLLRVNQFPHTVKMGLRNSIALHEALGSPAKHFDTIHIAGTNGKGSVSWKLAKALESSGFKTGLFVSPHVSCFRERIQVNGNLISEAQLEDLLPTIFDKSTQLAIPATFFELTTALALQHFAREEVDCVVLETGLGGRLDATNIVTPVVSVITSIGLDHTSILGSTLPEIAREKAGIIKPSVPVVCGPNTQPDVMREFAQRANAPIAFLNDTPRYADDFNVENTDLATLAAETLNQSGKSKVHIKLESPLVQHALQSRPPCRFETVQVPHHGVTAVLDVAHNLPAFDRLLKLLQATFRHHSFRFVCGFSADKDIGHVIDSIMATRASHVHFVQGYHPRCASMVEIQHALGKTAQDAVSFHSAEGNETSVGAGVKAAIHAAAEKNSSDEEIVVVCGSVFIMAEARQALGFNEPVDSDDVKRISGVGLKTAREREASLQPK
ncbi:hypothetical protein H310_01163 [Aphanomyces invadans]|uniref:Uncharacterized protein n=1 Tax=Aphanomyces invadans TaxID=157072 RepID=A0A024USH5_9STRA|nr:hypothetical protein H310_01163 [Aphanomyces invadans]ETW08623.1 hypothetical protein H310_01163 [Aphanomyces invadans]|eukprot:XP_008862428.1 hypothetical protein H310_01163 [Aphanomyces invadans]